MSSREDAPPSTQVTLHDHWLRVHFGPGRGYADFHHRWLRHQCDLDRHPATGERTLDSSELPDDLRALSAEVEQDTLSVVWSHGERRSRYPLAWLEQHAYARDRADAPRPENDPARVSVVRRQDELEQAMDRALALVAERGVVIVRAAERSPSAADETEALITALERRGLVVVPTHFGRVEDLRTDNTTNANTDQLGYTDAAVDVHTDQPFLDQPPRYQLLQSLRAADRGGENAIVDVGAVFAWLRAHDARAAEVLSTVPVHFHRRQKAFERSVVAPIITPEGPSLGRPLVRYSYFTMAPQRLPFERMGEWYRAYDTFGRLVRAEQNQIRFALSPGDFVLYDNHRMLHARTAFTGARWVRGVYFDAADSVTQAAGSKADSAAAPQPGVRP